MVVSAKKEAYMLDKIIAVIGAGNMGSSLIGGLIASNYDPSKVWAADPDHEKCARLAQQFHIRTTNQNQEALEAADIVLLAIKPQVMANTIKNFGSLFTNKRRLIISIAAGIPINPIEKWLGIKNVPIIRAMPNTPALIRCGATALYANENADKSDRAIAEGILKAVGVVVWLEDESLMDVVTALSGSGPAYFFFVMEILQQTAMSMGLTPDLARLLTAQTALGAARMVLENPAEIATLRQQVTSPGGTTERALQVLAEAQLPQHFYKALLAAKVRSQELATELGDS